NVDWENARLATRSLSEEVMDLKQQTGKDILIGSPSLIVQSLNLNLFDEFQVRVQPTVLGKGLELFKNINDRIDLALTKTKTFRSGSIVLYLEPTKS
ncbi:MAG: dihydrofolate reductase family protein, partial [Candidatus Kapaibacterium sp.]